MRQRGEVASDAMGYTLRLLDTGSAEPPAEVLGALVATAENRAADPEKEARKERIVARLVALEPDLKRFPKKDAALRAALPDLSSGQIDMLARAVELTGWPGVQISLDDDWVTIEVATWPELNQPDVAERLVRVCDSIVEETGWSVVDENSTMASPRESVQKALATAAEWGRRVGNT
jgi:hypothetical protein